VIVRFQEQHTISSKKSKPMKITKKHLAALSSLVVIACAATAQSQTYSLSTSLQPFDLLFNDNNVTFMAFPISGATFTGSTIISPGVPSIEQTGSFLLPASTLTQTFDETRTITLPPVFPNPPQTVTLTGTLTLTASIAGGEFSLDTGARPLNYLSPNTYSFNGSLGFVLPVDVSYALVTGGQTYTGSSVVNFPMLFQGGSQLDTTEYPTSIGLDPNPNIGPVYPGVITVASVAAANGFDSTITITPEPPTLALGAAGAVAMLLIGRRVRR
jgi:hypothetical protein